MIAKTLLGVIAGAGVTAVLTPVLNTWIFGTDPGSFLHVLEKGMFKNITSPLPIIYIKSEGCLINGTLEIMSQYCQGPHQLSTILTTTSLQY